MDLDAETLEAEIRRLMAAHAAIADRGFDTARQRAELRAKIDGKLDTLRGDMVPGDNECVDRINLAAYMTFATSGDPAAATCGICDAPRLNDFHGIRMCRVCDAP